jgi:hypothetical protein
MAQEPLKTVPMEIVGVWRNMDNEFLRIDLYGKFKRVKPNGVVISEGRIEVTSSEYFLEQEIRVYRDDVDDNYVLGYVINNRTFVVTKPHNKKEAWLFEKVTKNY